jgi:hypothetical protein
VIDAGSLEFAHARIWARQGDAAGEALWRRIEVTRDFAAALEIARASPLARWLEGLGADTGAHAIERVMRRHWRDRVVELASWMPQPWQAAVQWCGVLIDLPALQHLAGGTAPAQWMADDPSWKAIVTDGAPVGTAWQPLLVAARTDVKTVLPRWQDEWARRLPRGFGRATLDEQLVPLLAEHVAAFAAPQASDGWALRQVLQRRLLLMLRRVLLEPASAFVYLALCALEFERLRGELLRRAVFAHSAGSRIAP